MIQELSGNSFFYCFAIFVRFGTPIESVGITAGFNWKNDTGYREVVSGRRNTVDIFL